LRHVIEKMYLAKLLWNCTF